VQFSEEQIWALAPDEASKKAGKDLAHPEKWISKGANDVAIWGECKGSGSKPYETQIHVETITFKCSCPSRKFPCKHSIGLLVLFVKNKSFFTDLHPPKWVTDWLNKKAEQTTKKVEQKDKPVDEFAQAKRLQAREQLVENGIDELLLWIKDVVKNGIVSMPENGTSILHHLAKRMVDAKSQGLASILKKMAVIDYYSEGWEEKFLSQLIHLYLTISGFKNKTHINELLLEDVRSNIGFTIAQEQLKTKQGITDNWMVIGKQTIHDDDMVIEKNWLYGCSTKQYALIIQFSVRWQINSLLLMPGSCVHATLVYYPSAWPLRAIIKEQFALVETPKPIGFNNWNEVSSVINNNRAMMPLTIEIPFIIHQVLPVFYQNTWWLKDETHTMVRMPNNFTALYTLLAISGGQAIDVSVVGNGDIFQPIGVWLHHQFFSL